MAIRRPTSVAAPHRAIRRPRSTTPLPGRFPGIAFECIDLAYQQIIAGNFSLIVFPICVLLVFLVMTAQYESLTLPLSVILILPMSIFSALAGMWLTHADNNIFTQIGLIVLAGLSSKNAILIEEFAQQLEEEGRSVSDAAIQACKVRLRPILMTSIALITGVSAASRVWAPRYSLAR